MKIENSNAGETLIHDKLEKLTPPIEEINVSETSKERKKKEFEGIERIVIKGSIAFALKLGKDLGFARDIDIFFVKKNWSSEVSVQNFQNIEQAKEKLTSQEYSTIEGFI